MDFFARQYATDASEKWIDGKHWGLWNRSIAHYAALGDFAGTDRMLIHLKRFSESGSNDSSHGPFQVKYTDGATYHLRLIMKNVANQPLRFSMMRLEVFIGADQTKPVAAAERRLNLSADNMPDAGEVGILTERQFGDAQTPERRVYIKNFKILACDQ